MRISFDSKDDPILLSMGGATFFFRKFTVVQYTIATEGNLNGNKVPQLLWSSNITYCYEVIQKSLYEGYIQSVTLKGALTSICTHHLCAQ